ncbi:hypothetical protein F5B21DRAFT_469472 [Xylaria acuta]|nr:hypothetical protein F5B21DRAFT_469472 [Xylaria acuta]
MGDDDTGAFLKKSVSGEIGYGMMRAFESENTLYELVPEYVPRPVSFGTYRTQSDLHFYICEFVDMVDEFLGLLRGPNQPLRYITEARGSPQREILAFIAAPTLLSFLSTISLHGPDEDAFFDVLLPKYLRPYNQTVGLYPRA